MLLYKLIIIKVSIIGLQSNTVRVIKSKRLRWTGHVARME